MVVENRPLVSIIIPVFNGANFLHEAIDSALAQTYPNIEIIVINDGSTDETESIALSYGDRIRYYRKTNGGVSSALNFGIREMKGDYFSWLSHDDKYAPEKIEHQVLLLSRFNNDKLIAVCGTKQINKYSELIRTKRRKFKYVNQIVDARSSLKRVMTKGTLNGCALLIPRNAFNDCGLFEESLRYSQDAYMWMQFFIKGYQLVFSNELDAFMRIHDMQLTQTGRAVFRKDSLFIGEKLFESFAELSSRKDNYVYLFAKMHAKYNNPLVVNSYIEKGRTNRYIGGAKICKLKLFEVYGRIRPTIRKMYYRVFKHVKTQ